MNREKPGDYLKWTDYSVHVDTQYCNMQPPGGKLPQPLRCISQVTSSILKLKKGYCLM